MNLTEQPRWDGLSTVHVVQAVSWSQKKLGGLGQRNQNHAAAEPTGPLLTSPFPFQLLRQRSKGRRDRTAGPAAPRAGAPAVLEVSGHLAEPLGWSSAG